MGLVYLDLEVSRDGGPRETVSFLVDSGAAYSVLPWRVWRKLGLKPKRSLDFSLADGTTVRRRLSECRFRYRDVDATSPVVLGERHDAPLLGTVTLENMGLVLNPFERTLKPMRLTLASRPTPAGYPPIRGGADSGTWKGQWPKRRRPGRAAPSVTVATCVSARRTYSTATSVPGFRFPMASRMSPASATA